MALHGIWYGVLLFYRVILYCEMWFLVFILLMINFVPF